VAVLEGLLPASVDPLDPRLLAKAVGIGRVRGVAEQIDTAARHDVRHASGVLRRGLRDARMLHSRERRLVSDALYDGFRWGPVLEHATGVAGFDGRWLGWLLLRGLEIEQAPEVDAERWRGFLGRTLEIPDDALAGGHGVWPVIQAALGKKAEAFVQASDSRAPVHIRANVSRVARDALAERLQGDGLAVRPCEFAAHGLVVEERTNLRGHKAFTSGDFEIQDEGSQLLAELVHAQGLVVDFCAGAGGKSLAMAGEGVLVEAFDVRGAPLRELEKRASRAQLSIRVTQLQPDGGIPEAVFTRLVGRAERVLVDAPCTGSGTWRRHPELRWRLSQLDEIAALQAEILDRAAPLVRRGGQLIYGTCSVLPRENEDQVRSFLERNPAFEVVPVMRRSVARGPFMRVRPDTHDTDGFFGAVLERVRD
jgi:16S rRNA C967 or C1407 C5-methylase (RsmB/RsmF family)